MFSHTAVTKEIVLLDIYQLHRPNIIAYPTTSLVYGDLCQTEVKLSGIYEIKMLEKSHILRGVSESMDGWGCAILALEVVPKNLIFT